MRISNTAINQQNNLTVVNKLANHSGATRPARIFSFVIRVLKQFY